MSWHAQGAMCEGPRAVTSSDCLIQHSVTASPYAPELPHRPWRRSKTSSTIPTTDSDRQRHCAPPNECNYACHCTAAPERRYPPPKACARAAVERTERDPLSGLRWAWAMSARSGVSARSSRLSAPQSPHVESLDEREGDTLSRLVPQAPLGSTSARSQRLATGRSKDSHQTPTVNFNLSHFLADLGLAEYEDLLRETGFDDYRSILAIEEDDMDAIGMITGHKRKLLRAVTELNDQLQESGQLSMSTDSRFVKSPDRSVARGGTASTDTLALRRDSKASAGGSGGEGETPAAVKKMKRRRRVKDKAPPPPTIEEKAAAAPSEVIMESLFPGDGLNFPQDGEIARVHFVGKVRLCAPVTVAGFLAVRIGHALP